MRIILIRSNSVMPDPRVEKEVNSLIAYGHQVKILSWDRQNDSQSRKNGEITLSKGVVPIRWFLIKAGFGEGIKTLWALLIFQIYILLWLVKHNREYDAIHACDFDTSIPACLCSKFFKKKLVYDIFDYYVDAFQVPKSLKTLIEKIDIKIINSADAVIITNESRQRQISKSNPKKVAVIHNSPETDFESNPMFKENSKKRIVYVGILSEDRLLMEIVRSIAGSDIVELHIGGFGFLEREIKEYSEKYSNIFFYGKLRYSDTLKLEDNCDILIAVYNPQIPNHKYSSPNKLYEAMMLGKPIIVAKETGIDELVDLYELGRSVEYNIGSFEIALYEIIQKENEWISLKERSQSLYQQKYSWNIMDLRLKKLYEDL
ncbi:glycosyltransferase family 4 protein [Paenibacillus sp. FSL L8-0436]|uniref:glycosyltransferase family 4 protein n=1 Tax=Paenibacillus sp. FSL L8-0436 TaxID=2954686 RepID=UPI0031596EBA